LESRATDCGRAFAPERSAVGSLTRFDPSPFRSHNAAEVNDFIPTDHLEHKKAKRLDRFGHFSVVSAGMALADSGIDLAASKTATGSGR
jgi:3-oxoacyl-[acyl-carrier-protein] synthase II